MEIKTQLQIDYEDGLFGEVDEAQVNADYYLLRTFIEKLAYKVFYAFTQLMDNPKVYPDEECFYRYNAYKIRLHFNKDTSDTLEYLDGYNKIIELFSKKLVEAGFSKPLNLRFIKLKDGTKVLLGSTDHPHLMEKIELLTREQLAELLSKEAESKPKANNQPTPKAKPKMNIWAKLKAKK